MPVTPGTAMTVDLRTLYHRLRPGAKFSTFKVWLWRMQRVQTDPFPRSIFLSPGVRVFDLAEVEDWIRRSAVNGRERLEPSGRRVRSEALATPTTTIA
jgi:predicted DNA-binding transcriptional regulator AlpA